MRVMMMILAALVLPLGAADTRQEPPVVMERLSPVAIDKPRTVVGKGSPQSVTLEAIQRALNTGGTIVFNTGGKPVTVPVTKTLIVPLSQREKPIVLDGMGLVTLDGLEENMIMQKAWKTEITIQRLRFVNARTAESGAAINVENWDGRLTVIDCHFENCKTTKIDDDIGGGAINCNGQKHAIISGSTFIDCHGANGGAINHIGGQFSVIGCHFERCHAFGYGGGEGETGKGGIGGAIYQDGCSQNADLGQMYIGDSVFIDCTANDHAGAVFGFALTGNHTTKLIYYATRFENNRVLYPEGKPHGCGHGGAIYSQNAHLHMYYCDFLGNSTPKMGNDVFAVKHDSMKVVGCNFADGTGGAKFLGGADQQDVFSDSKRSIAAEILGRRPGPQAAQLAKQQEQEAKERELERKEKRAEAAARRAETLEALAPREPTSRGQETFEGLLRKRVQEGLAAGRSYRFHLAALKQTVELRRADGNVVSLFVPAMGSEVQMPLWDRLTIEDGKQLCADAMIEGDEEWHAIAAFFDFATGSHQDGAYNRTQAGTLADRVDAAFK